jgi:hypothetical protein
MRCQSCQSTRQVELPGEIAIHFPGRENLSTPHVFVFSDIVICLDCGSANFTVPQSELRSIRARAPWARARTDPRDIPSGN